MILNRVILVSGLCLCARGAYADSITINGQRHTNVHVSEGGSMYYARLPETGEIVSVRKSPEAQVALDAPKKREALLAQWKAARPGDNSAPTVAPSTPPAAAEAERDAD